MKKTKPDPAKEAALQDALRKVRKLPPNVQIAFERLMDLIVNEAEAKKSKLKAGAQNRT